MTQWPHMPVHYLEDAGAYIVTAGTYLKKHYFTEPTRLTFLQDTLFELSLEFDWRLQAWAFFSNHYHIVSLSPQNPSSLVVMVQRFHSITSREINKLDGAEGRQVWYQYWDTHLTYQKSYLARLKYVHQNPVKHGLVDIAEKYPWCSASWFEQKATPSFYRAVNSLKIDRVNVKDDF